MALVLVHRLKEAAHGLGIDARLGPLALSPHERALLTDGLALSQGLAAAAAAGLILGVVGGRLSTWQPTAPAQTAAVQVAPAAKAVDTARLTDPADLLLDPDVSQPQIHSLSAIDTLTPQVTVARASDRRR